MQGATASQLEKDIGHEFPQNEHYFGLVNVSMLAFFRSFRDRHQTKALICILNSFSAVWKHMLLQFSSASVIFLSPVPRASFGLQTSFQEERIVTDVSG